MPSDDATKSESEQVIAITDHGAIRFQSLREALDSKLVDTSDVIYQGFSRFREATSNKHLHRLCEQLGIEKPANIDDGFETSKQAVWDQIVAVSKAVDEVVPPAVVSSRPKQGRSTGSRGPGVKFPDDHVITILAEKNPKRGDAARRFNLYRNGMTVAEYLAAGGLRTDINWDSHVRNKWIRVDPPAHAPYAGDDPGGAPPVTSPA